MLADEHRFQSAARHYVSGRPPYAPRLIRRIAGLIGLGRDDRVLDLGCGPGMLAAAFAPIAREVLAMDPEREMLRVARVAFAAPNIEYRLGSSGDLPDDLGRFRLATMGRSFHWMDGPETPRRLDGMLVPGGAVAMLDAADARVPENTWHARFSSLIASYAGGLARDIEAMVAELAPDGRLREVIESQALIARRPAEVDA